MSEIKFWMQQPKPPRSDPRAWSLAVPSCLSAIGFVCFAILGYSFREFQVLPGAFRTIIVLTGAISIAAGGELGTVTTTVEIFRKHRASEVVWWDWASLIVSVMTTICAALVAASYLPEATGRWVLAVQANGPVGLMVLAPIDAYFGFIELGLYMGEYDERMVAWFAARERYDKREFNAILRERRANRAEPRIVATNPHEATTKSNGSATDSPRRRASRAEWLEIADGLNGGRAELNASRVNDILWSHGFERIPPSTARGWAEKARE